MSKYIGSTKQLSERIRELASDEIELSHRQTTIKETRFHQGKAFGLRTAAEMLDSLEIAETETLIWKL